MYWFVAALNKRLPLLMKVHATLFAVDTGVLCVLLQLAMYPCRSASATPLGSIVSVVEQPKSCQQSSTLTAATSATQSDDTDLKGRLSVPM
jgi:hypothetical protein